MQRSKENLESARKQDVPREAGFALLVVTVTVAILAAMVSDFGYSARVDFESAAGGRDQLRAEYLARSGINLSRLLIKVQSAVVDKLNYALHSDFQIKDFAPYLLAAFGGGDDERKAMGDFLGVNTSGMKGLGVSKGGSFDVVFDVEDGKININCGGGYPAMFPNNAPPPPTPGQNGQPQQPPPPLGPNGLPNAILGSAPALYSMLLSVSFAPRYNAMFEKMTSDGQYVTRDEVARALVDWTDIDQARFDPAAQGGTSSGNEDYHYDSGRDAYRAHDNFFDTVDEIQLVHGVGDDYYRAFSQLFTVYGGCKVNLRAVSQDNWPITVAILRTAAANPDDPVLRDDVIVSALAQQMAMLAQILPSATNTVADWVKLASTGGVPPPPPIIPGQAPPPPIVTPFPGLPGLALSTQKLGLLAKSGPREVYRLESTGSVQRAGGRKIQVRVKAVFDTKHYNQNTTSADPNDRNGTWVYWRME